MSQVTYLIRIGASYYARLRVPLDLREIVGAEFRKKSLRTKDRDEAKRRMWPVIEEWNREFDDLRSRRNVSVEDRDRAGWDHYSGALERDEIARQHMPTPDEIEKAREDAVATIKRDGIDMGDNLAVLNASADFLVAHGRRKFDAHARRVKLDTLRRHLTEGEFALIADEVDEFIRKNRLLTKPGSSDYADLARRMMRAEIQYLERSLERDAGDYSGTSKDPVVAPPTGTARETAKPGETIMELFEKYARQNPKRIRPDTLNQARRDIRSFLEVHGTGFPAHQIDKPAVAASMDLLALYPVKATETKAFAGMKLPQIVKENERIGKPTLMPRTINRYLSSVGAFCEWLAKRGVLQANPTRGMFLAKDKRQKIFPFSDAQLKTLFSSPLFTGCQNDDYWRYIAKPGKVAIRDYRYWVPLVMLYSGARPGEIAQLGVNDVRSQGDVWFMHITELGDDDKSTKTGGSKRVVPVVAPE